MLRNSVTSSLIKSVGYDKEKQILEIEFTNGAVYDYSNVPESVYNTLIGAESIGKAFYREIKGKFDYKRV